VRTHVVDILIIGVLVAVYLAMVAQFLVISVGRMTYLFELEWFEGLAIDNAWRLAHGLPIYGPPDASFGASHYPPLYYVAALPFLLATGWSLTGPRLLSWLSVAGCAVVAARVVRRAGGSWVTVLFALGTMASFYPATGYWYDLARVDAFETFLALAGVSALASPDVEPDRRRLLAGALLLTGATFTKQTAAPLGIAAVAAFALARDWRRAWWLAVMLGALGGASTLALWLWSHGWISLIYTLPRHHHVALEGLSAFGRFAAPMLPLLLLATAGAGRATTRMFLVVAVVALAVGASTFCKVGGEANSSLPAVFLLATAAGVASQDVWRWLGTAPHRREIRLAGVIVLVATPLLAGALPGDVRGWIPSLADRREARALWEDMRGTPGEFLAYNYSFVSTVLRGRTWAVGDRLYDFAGGFDAATFRRPILGRYPSDFLDAIRGRGFAAIYTNGTGIPNDPVETFIRRHYVVQRIFGSVDFSPSVPRWRMCTPRVKWVPRPQVVPRSRSLP